MKKIKSIILLSLIALIVSTVSSCSKDDDDNLKFQDVSITAGSTMTLSTGKDLKWTSENNYIATISNGEIEAKRVGEVKMASDKGTFKVKVTPQYSYFNEPYMQFDASKQSVKNAMKSYSLIGETDDALLYQGNGYTTYIMYSFENSKLKYSYIMTKSTYSTQVANWTAERYIYVTDTSDYIGMISVDKKTLVFISPMKLNNSWYYTIGYAKYDKNSSNAKSLKAPAFNEKAGENIDYTEYCITDLKNKLK